MSTYLNPAFYAAVAILYCGIQLQPAWCSRTVWFGALNLAALIALFGAKAAAAFFAFASLLWLSLYFLQRSKQGRLRLEIGTYGAVTVLFLLHKQVLLWTGVLPSSHPEFDKAAQVIASFFETIAFAYLYLRSLDVIRVVSNGGKLLDPLSLSGYLLPFFMVPAGPINVYVDHARINAEPVSVPTWSSFVAGIDTITSGLFLKFVIAELWKLYFIGLPGVWPTNGFLDSIIIFVYVYFDFFGYSLVALGVGRLLGIPTPINFKAPFLSTSVTEFWTKWHVSLGDFVRRGLFIPLQVSMVRRFGRRWSYATNLVALILCFAFVGLWHRFTWTFVAWGFFVGVIVALEKILRDRWVMTEMSRMEFAKQSQRILGPVYVFLVIVGTLHLAIPELMGQVR